MNVREVKSPTCLDPAIIMRVGRDSLRCRCMECRYSFNTSKEAPKRKKPKPKKKQKKKGPVRRTYAGLKGTRVSKREWTFKYPTNEYGPLWLKTTKNTWNNWSVWWAAERVASGDTIKEALEKAKKRLDDRGYHLSDI